MRGKAERAAKPGRQGVASREVFHRRSNTSARLTDGLPLAKVAHATSPTWLAWPTLNEASFGYEAVGAVHHVAELARIIGRWGDIFTAELLSRKPGNTRVLYGCSSAANKSGRFLMAPRTNTGQSSRRFALAAAQRHAESRQHRANWRRGC